MASDSRVSHCEDVKGFPKLLRDTIRYLEVQGYPEYCALALPGKEGPEWTVMLYIRDSLALTGWYTTVVRKEFLDACRIAARDAMKKICSTYRGMVQHSPMRFYPPMNKMAPAWRKRTAVLAEISKSKDPTIAYLALYVDALDDEYDKLSGLYNRLITRNREMEAKLIHLRASQYCNSPSHQGRGKRSLSGFPHMGGTSNPPDLSVPAPQTSLQQSFLRQLQT